MCWHVDLDDERLADIDIGAGCSHVQAVRVPHRLFLDDLRFDDGVARAVRFTPLPQHDDVFRPNAQEDVAGHGHLVAMDTRSEPWRPYDCDTLSVSNHRPRDHVPRLDEFRDATRRWPP